MSEGLKKYYADTVYQEEGERLFRASCPPIEVYLAADVEAVLKECRVVLSYHLQKNDDSKSRRVTVDWDKARRLLARLEGVWMTTLRTDAEKDCASLIYCWLKQKPRPYQAAAWRFLWEHVQWMNHQEPPKC